MIKTNDKQNYAYLTILFLLAIVLAVRACYSFCWSDESFYLTFTDRLLKGESLILNEWHPAQFYSVLLLPFAAIYQRIVGNIGIYLFFRLLMVVFSLSVSVFLFYSLKPFAGSMAAFLSGCTLLLYSRANISGGSYYNLFVLCAVLSLCMMLQWKRTEGRKCAFYCVISGIFSAFSVLCMPYFALFVILGAFFVFLLVPDCRKAVLYFCLGIFTAAVVFLLFFIPRDFPDVLQNLKFILSDPEHDSGALANLEAAIWEAIYTYWRFAIAAFFLSLCVLLYRYVPRLKHIKYIINAVMVIEALYAVWRFRNAYPGYGYYAMAIILLPWLLYAYLEGKIHKTGLFIRLLGLTGILSFALGSNTELDATTAGVVFYIIGMLLQLDYMSQEKRKNDVFRITAGIIVCCTLLCTLNSRITVVYRDAPLKELNTRISSGPAAGLMTSEEHAAQYAGILAVLEELNERYSPDNSVFITQLMPWGYLVTDFAYGAPTAWRTSLSSMRLQEYYEIYPDAVPEIVVVLEEHLGSFPDRPVPNANEYSGWFWNYLQQNAYTVEENEYASIYLASNVHEKEK